MNCKDCNYWDSAAHNPENGRCVANPPTCTVVQGRDLTGQVAMQVLTFWPETRATDRCSKWERDVRVKLA